MADREGCQGAEPDLTYDPGADAARRFPEWTIRHKDLHGVPEVMCPVRRVILLENGHDRAERRCHLAHALAHIDLEHMVQNGVLSAKQELAADRLAARRLLPVRALVKAFAWSETFEEAAHELDVDGRMLWVRLRHLHPSEHHLLRKTADSKYAGAQ